MSKLRARDPELRDLARRRVGLFDAKSGQFTGVTLTRLIGVGGMATVFAAELDPARRSSDLSDQTPPVLAIKIMKPATLAQIDRTKESVEDYFRREVIALGRVMERTPPTELVVGCFGSGVADVLLYEDEERVRLPWIAIELVSGGLTGVALTTRVEREIEGIDPLRALRLIRRIIEGVLILHSEGVIHRDLKPDNVLVAGPVDDETPKLADCGIARVEGLPGTVVGLTYAYGAPEQLLSAPGVRNPLIGIWTDVHALSGVVWFILAGEDWCRSEDDTEWGQGHRRSLRSAARLHPGLVASGDVIDRIDEVLRRGAAPKLPATAWNGPAKGRYEAAIRLHLPSMFEGVERYGSVQEFAVDLLPLLEDVAARWKARAAREKRPATALRPTYLPGTEIDTEPLVTVRERPLRLLTGAQLSIAAHPLASGGPVMAAYQPDGKVLGLFGDQLMSIVHEEGCVVPIKSSLTPFLIASKWLVRGPRAGFALVGHSHVLLIGRDAEPTSMLLPRRPSGERPGNIVAAIGDGRVFGVVTSAGEDSGADPELWLSEDGFHWTEPAELPLGGTIHAIASGHHGFLVVGMRKSGKARALFLGYDGACRLITKHVTDRPPLWACVCGTGRDSWAAGEDVIWRFDGDTAEPEHIDTLGRPVAMGLDLVGIPWLVTRDTVLRRHAGITGPKWTPYYRRDPGRPALAAIGFTPEGAHVLDATANSVLLAPHDIDRWGS